MTIRTTLSLDDDNAVRLERMRKARDANFKDVVNEAIRTGLNTLEQQVKKREPFQTKVFNPGPPLMDKSPKEMLRDLDDEYLHKKLFPR